MKKADKEYAASQTSSKVFPGQKYSWLCATCFVYWVTTPIEISGLLRWEESNEAIFPVDEITLGAKGQNQYNWYSTQIRVLKTLLPALL